MIPNRTREKLALFITLTTGVTNIKIPIKNQKKPPKPLPTEPGIPLSKHVNGRKRLSRKQRKLKNKGFKP